MQFSLVKTAWAAVNTDLPAETNLSSYTKFGEFLGAAVNIGFYTGIAVCLIYAAVAGIKYASAGGDPKSTNEAKSTLTNALIGFVVLLTFRWILGFIINRMLGGDVVDITLPTTW